MSEYFDVVDEKDEIVGKSSRKECHEKGLIHRCIQVIVFNSEGQLMLQKRSESMDTFPGRFTSSAAGHVDSGENYEDAAKRELEEELKISAALERVGPAKSYEKEHMQNIMVFKTVSEGPFKKEESEISELVFLSKEEIAKKMKSDPDQFTPAFREVFKLLENI